MSQFEDKGSVINVEHAEDLKERSAVERLQWMADELAVGKGELLLRENFSLVSPLSVHSFPSVSANTSTMKRNRTGATLSPCLTPTLKYIVGSNSPITNLTTLSCTFL